MSNGKRNTGMTEYIKLEDLKAWRANRIRQGNCNFDDMTALGKFIDEAETYRCTEGRRDENQVLL